MLGSLVKYWGILRLVSGQHLVNIFRVPPRLEKMIVPPTLVTPADRHESGPSDASARAGS